MPEANRQRFRNCQKESNQTYVEFARKKEQLFDRWCNSKKVNQNHENLRELMLIEEFKRCIHHDIRTFLDDQKAATIENASRLADDYALTHKSSFVSRPPQSYGRNVRTSENSNVNKSHVSQPYRSDRATGQSRLVLGLIQHKTSLILVPQFVGFVGKRAILCQIVLNWKRGVKVTMILNWLVLFPSHVICPVMLMMCVAQFWRKSPHLTLLCRVLNHLFIMVLCRFQAIWHSNPVKILRDTGAYPVAFVRKYVPVFWYIFYRY